MLKFYTLLLFIAVSNPLLGQKNIEKIFDANQVKKVIIAGDGMYAIVIQTAPIKTIQLKAKISGETFENIIITQKAKENTITFGLDSTPFFEAENDKLAAHKVVSIALQLLLPEHIDVTVVSNLASVQAAGTFKHLNVSLEQGLCAVTNFLGNGTFHTLKGTITVQTKPQVSGVALSQYGEVTNTLRKDQPWKIAAQSKYGNIHLSHTK